MTATRADLFPKTSRRKFSRDTLTCVALLLVTVGAGVHICLELLDRGCGYLAAVACGAAGAVLLIVRLCSLGFTATSLVWRYTRGYPFIPGDLVIVTRGPWVGASGRVVAPDQAGIEYEVALGDDGQRVWLHASQLRRVKSS